MIKLISRLMLVLTLAGFTGIANASLIKYRFEGVTRGGLLAPPGSNFVLDLIIDPSTTSGCGNPDYGCYSNGGVVSYSLFYGMDLTPSPILGPPTFGAQLTVYNNLSGNDQFRFASELPLQLGYYLEVSISLLDSTQTAFSSGSFPANLQLSDFDRAFLTLSGVPEGEVQNIASVSFISSITTIPAPATLALFSLGLAGLGWSMRKKV